jgi:predicted transcriptional regulator
MLLEVIAMKKQDTNTVIRISRAELARVKAVAAGMDRSASWVMRTAISEYVAKQPKASKPARKPKLAAEAALVSEAAAAVIDAPLKTTAPF